MTTHLFISDLHLSEQYPCLVQGFFALLQHYQSYPKVELYILGDWFNAWLGDDIQNAWLDDIIQHLQRFNQAGHQIYFLVGNRDFLLGQKFLQYFNAILLDDVHYLNIAHLRIRVEHGDALCTDDVEYQRFKKIIRSPIVLKLLKSLPLTLRQHIAQHLRQKSQKSHQHKTFNIMDVNSQAVESALKDVDILIHGHTHQPNIHQYAEKQRIVLGDWRQNATSGNAMILEINDNHDIKFYQWNFTKHN